ncbi:MAG: amidohydrolase family protein [Planctomycetota bacterium]
MQIRGRRYDDGTSVVVTFGKGVVTDIKPVSADANDPWLAPGFVDLQVNGYGGQEFNDFALTTDKVIRVSQAMDADGVTSYLPTATTHSFEMLSNTMKMLAAACEESREVARRVPGFHLEGPYISQQDGPRGAHPLEHCRPPDWDEFQRLQQAAGGRIRILTLSPEYDGAAAFIAKAVAAGVLIAIGHTAADSDQIRAAVDAGATMSTHLGNGAHGQIRRHPNYIWDQLAEDRLVASLIVDGHHLPPAVVKSFVRGKSSRRCVLVSDLVGMAGMPPGQYTNTSIGNIEILAGGKIVVAGQQQYLAGAGLPITYGVANIMRFTDCDLKTAIEMASIRPAELIGQSPAQLAVGSRADLVVFDLPTTGPVKVRQTINQGEVVFAAA